MEMQLDTPRGPLAIRPTRPADAPRLRELRLDALRTSPEAFGGTYEDAAARAADSWVAWAERGAGSPHGVTYVADAGDMLVAMTALNRPEAPRFHHAALIQAVYVRPAWRGLGLSGTLIDACAAWGRTAGVRILRLSVVTGNAAAVRTYVRRGFTVYGVEHEALYHEGAYLDELLMMRRL